MVETEKKETTKRSAPLIAATFRLYSLCWRMAIPFLKRNPRIAQGFTQRTLEKGGVTKADIWIQCASAGESLLAVEILRTLRPKEDVKMLLTSGTSQGIDILNRGCSDILPGRDRLTAAVAYFPLDHPGIMEKALETVRPKVMVLLETEIWPGLLRALKRSSTRSLLLNGRITPKSLSRYLLFPSLWPELSPDRILAVSREDADRFGTLFRKEKVEVMPNIKFDRFTGTPAGSAPFSNSLESAMKGILPENSRFLVLGSTRQEEEEEIARIIHSVIKRRPDTVVGLFPRHMERLSAWEKILGTMGIRFSLRSKISQPVSNGSVILWDTFGELSGAYSLASAAFVGGSLAPLGGQNFLEPLACGVLPVIGPHWKNFSWVGEGIVAEGLLLVAPDREAVARLLIQTLDKTPPRDSIVARTKNYLKTRQGGTRIACDAVNRYLQGDHP